MRRHQPYSIIAIVLLLTTLVIAATANPGQVRKPGQGIEPGPSMSKTKLEVQQFSGDFEQWQKSLIINSAEKITFRYSTDEPAAASAIWQVSDKPFPSGPQASSPQGPHVIASGASGNVPAKGHISLFEINFALFAPKWPPYTPANYWVTVIIMNAAQKVVGMAAQPVKIVYQEPVAPVKFADNMGLPKPKMNLKGFKFPPSYYKYAISYENIKCLEETSDGPGSDEPYAMVWVGDLTPDPDPSNRYWIFGPYEDVDDEESRQESTRIWYPNYGWADKGSWNKPAKIPDPSKVLIIAALMENDLNVGHHVFEESVKEVSLTFRQLMKDGMPRLFISNRLRDVWAKELDRLTNHPGQLDEDERIDYPQELIITEDDLKLCSQDLKWHFKTLDFIGDGGKYRFTFAMRAELPK